MTFAGHAGAPCSCAAPATPPPGRVAAEIAGLAMGMTQAGLGVVRGVVEGLMWGGCGRCSSAGCCGHACGGCASHCYVFECYPCLPSGCHGGCCGC